MIKNRRGVIALAVVISMLLVISAMAVFGMVSGRFSLTAKANKKIQDLRDAESASYVTYQLLMDGAWAMPAPGSTASHTVTLNEADSAAVRNTVTVDIDGTKVSGVNPIKAKATR